jgi:hypothetical protein
MLLTASCKTTEQDYRRAYDRTINAVDSTRTEFSETIYGRYRRAVREEMVKVGNDTISTRIISNLKVTDDCGATTDDLKRYCVVAAEFKQLFNAKSMQERLIENGKQAFIVENPEPFYYVLAGSFTELQPALDLIKALRSQTLIRFKEPAPYLMEPSKLR